MIRLMDCTLRDGANVVGKGFDAKITKIVMDILTESGVPIIEMGNAGGIGAYEVAGFTNALTDTEYLELIKPYLGKAEIGMFLNAKRYREAYIELGAGHGLNFLRCGADTGDAKISVAPVKAIKKYGMKAYYSAMKAYLLSPEELAEEAKFLEDCGLDQFTIMDSAGTMLPDDVARASEACVKAVKIPVAFHCHNNLGLSAANALAAYENGVEILDCGLMGMARSAGNMPTEAAVAVMQKYGEFKEIDLYSMLNGIDTRLMPAMEKHQYHNSIPPYDLVLGISGAHSSFGKLFKTVASEANVDLYRLIVEVSRKNRKNPSEELIRETARELCR